jgi:hypothetical protein
MAQAHRDTIVTENIPVLNQIAKDYNWGKWVLGALVILVPFGVKFYLKSSVNEWVEKEISKKSGLKIEDLKTALADYIKNGELKKKKILILSQGDGQQGNVKKILDACSFSSYSWKNIKELPTLVLDGADLVLLNDQPDAPISEDEITKVMGKFKTNVSYLYFGPNNTLPIGQYRKQYPLLALGLCNSSDRLETGILSLLKII